MSHVDGEKGELIIAGELVEPTLAATMSFSKAVTARLWSLGTASPVTEAEVRRAFGLARGRAFERLAQLLPAAGRALSVVDGLSGCDSGAARRKQGLSHDAVIVGAMRVFAAALVRRRRNEAPIAPNPDHGHAFDTHAHVARGRSLRARKPQHSTLIS